MKLPTILLTLLLVSCSPPIHTENLKKDQTRKSLSSSIKALIKKYPDYPIQTSLNADTSLSSVYRIISSHFYPRLDSLTFELREFTPCGGCWSFQFINIYNGSNQCLIPLIDEYFYWLASQKTVLDSDSLENLFSFEKEINNALKKLNFRSHYQYDHTEKFLEIIMNIKGYSRISFWDLPKLKLFTKDYIEESNMFNSNCKLKFKQNLMTIEEELMKPNIRIYNSNFTTYLIRLKGEDIHLQALNFECNSRFLF